MSYNKSINFIFAIFCIFMNITIFSSHSPAPRDEEASSTTLSNSIIRSEKSSPEPNPAFPTRFVMPARESELFESNTSNSTYEPQTPRSSKTSGNLNRSASKTGIITLQDLITENNNLKNQITAIRKRFFKETNISDEIFAANLAKLKDEEMKNFNTAVRSCDPVVQEMSQYVKEYWPEGKIQIIEPTDYDSIPENALTGVYGNSIALFPEFFRHSKKKQLADLIASVEHIKSDDFYIMNLMNDYCNEKFFRLSESVKRQCEDLMVMNEFLCIQTGYIQCILATQDPEIQEILKRNYDNVQRDNQNIPEEIAKLDFDEELKNTIESTNYIKTRDKQAAEKAQVLKTLITLQAKKPKKQTAAKKRGRE